MSWLSRHRNQVYRTAVGAMVVGLILLLVVGVDLYQQRKDTEASIAERYSGSQPVETLPGGGIVVETAAVAAQPISEVGETADLAAPALLSENVVQWQDKEYRRNTYVKSILCMGVDRTDPMGGERAWGEAGQADGIFLIAWDTARNTMKILMIPRDTMTEITATDRERTREWKEVNHLTLAYAYGRGGEDSCKKMSEAVSNLMNGLEMDHYLATDIQVIGILNDAVGGVTVTIPTEGMEERDPAFVKGAAVTLDGEQAEAFVRYRDTNLDNSAIFRMNQEQEYITGFFEQVKLRSRSDSQIVSRLFDQIQDYMVTDMDKSEYLKIALDALQGGDLTAESFRTVPGYGTVTERYDEFYANQRGLTEVLLELFYREV